MHIYITQSSRTIAMLYPGVIFITYKLFNTPKINYTYNLRLYTTNLTLILHYQQRSIANTYRIKKTTDWINRK